MDSSLNLKPKLDYPTSIETLAEFKECLMDAITRNDQALFDYLAQNFAVGPNGVLFIGGEYFSHSGRDASSNDKRTRT